MAKSCAASEFIKERYTPFRAEGGKLIHFESAEYKAVESPWDHKPIATVGWMSEGQALENLSTLEASFRRRAYPKTHERIAILKRAARRIEERSEAFADLIAWEGGKPLKDARVEVLRAVSSLEIAAEEARRLAGSEIPMRGTKAASGHIAFTYPEPIGVVLAISAFNHPLNLIAHQVGPAIAVGCPVMVKPASATPLSCLHLLDELYEAGLPPEMCLPLTAGGDVAEAIARSGRVAFVSFIGSSRVGWHLRSVLAPGTRFSLEHGGSAPVIVDATADLDRAIPSLLRGGFYHSGQVCVSVQRVFVHEGIAAEFERRFVAAVSALKTGDARSSETDCGPIIRSRDLDRIESWVDQAVAAGAKVRCGGRRVGETCYAPTVLSGAHDDDKVMKEEIFGPVVCVNSFARMEDAIARANSVPWAFQSAIYSRDVESALQAARGLRGSAVMINEATTFRVDWMPFRGDGPSGFGTGGIPYSMRDLVSEKLVVLSSPSFDL